jgi:hypothetical protein
LNLRASCSRRNERRPNMSRAVCSSGVVKPVIGDQINNAVTKGLV